LDVIPPIGVIAGLRCVKHNLQVGNVGFTIIMVPLGRYLFS